MWVTDSVRLAANGSGSAVSQVKYLLVNQSGSTMQLNVYEAKTQLSNLLDRALAGETVVIARAGKPLVRLEPIEQARKSRSGVKFGGLSAKQLGLAPDFYEAFTDEDLIGHK
jgi:prevent-host-death family protein